MKNSKLIHIKETKYEPNIGVTQPANWSPGRPKDVELHRPQDVSKDPIWPSREHPNLTSRGRSNLVSWGRSEMTSRERLNLTFMGRPWEVESGPSQMFSGRPLQDLESTQTCMSNFFFNFSFWTYSIDLILKKHFNTQGVLRTQ